MKAEKILFDGKTVRNFYDDRPYYNVKLNFYVSYITHHTISEKSLNPVQFLKRLVDGRLIRPSKTAIYKGILNIAFSLLKNSFLGSY